MSARGSEDGRMDARTWEPFYEGRRPRTCEDRQHIRSKGGGEKG